MKTIATKKQKDILRTWNYEIELVREYAGTSDQSFYAVLKTPVIRDRKTKSYMTADAAYKIANKWLAEYMSLEI